MRRTRITTCRHNCFTHHFQFFMATCVNALLPGLSNRFPLLFFISSAIRTSVKQNPASFAFPSANGCVLEKVLPRLKSTYQPFFFHQQTLLALSSIITSEVLTHCTLCQAHPSTYTLGQSNHDAPCHMSFYNCSRQLLNSSPTV